MKINLIFGNRYHKEMIHKVYKPRGWASDKQAIEKHCLESEEKTSRAEGKFFKGIFNSIGG